MRAKQLSTFLSIIFIQFIICPLLFASTTPFNSKHGINFAVGNKYLSATDFSISTPVGEFAFKRFYNSQSTDVGILGYGWTTPYEERLINLTTRMVWVQSSGRDVHFIDNAGTWENQNGKQITFDDTGAEYKITELNGVVRTFNNDGNITSKTDRNGNTINFTYDSVNTDQLNSISDNFGNEITLTYVSGYLHTLTTPIGVFTYDVSGDNLIKVTRPDTKFTTYLYEDPNETAPKHNLTSIKNEYDIKIQTIGYDTDDRVTRSVIGDDTTSKIEPIAIVYPVDPAGLTRDIVQTGDGDLGTTDDNVTTNYTLEIINGVYLVFSYDGPTCCGGTSTQGTYTYNSRGQVSKFVDAKEYVTEFEYDTATGNRLSKTEASDEIPPPTEPTGLERVTSWTYKSGSNRVASITKKSVVDSTLDSTTTTDYEVWETVKEKVTITESGYKVATPDPLSIERITEYIYDDMGRIESIDGPLSGDVDKTTYTYYPNLSTEGLNRGQLHTVTNPLGITTYENYNIFGKPEKIIHPTGSGDDTILDYDNLTGRLISTSKGTLTTTYQYYDDGRLHIITPPGQGPITYTYKDESRRVETVTDDLGNKIKYIYEPNENSGKPVTVEFYSPPDPPNFPNEQKTYFIDYAYYDTKDLYKITQAGESVFTELQYDLNGNLQYNINPLGKTTEFIYDDLNRSKEEKKDFSATTVSTQFQYDTNDNVVKVIDNLSKETTYIYDDFGRVTFETSPDTGTTSYDYNDANGDVTVTDAKGIIRLYTFDALGRQTGISYPTDDPVVLGHDSGANGKGKLTSVSNHNGAVAYNFGYNSREQLESVDQVIDSNHYTLTYGLNSTTGNLDTLTYPSGTVLTYERNGIGQITGIQLDAVQLIDSVTYLPFGGIEDYNFSIISQLHDQTFDQRYMIDRIQTGTVLDYDYTVNSVGNVESVTGKNPPIPTPGTVDIPFNSSVSNKIADSAYTHDLNGNITDDGTFTYIYNQQNRIIQIQQNSNPVANYVYDGFNRRVKKTIVSNADTTIYHYDQNSLLIAETFNGSLSVEYFYLGTTLVALKKYGTQSGTYYVVNDHLSTPQLILDSTGNVVWKAYYGPYGKAQLAVNNIEFNFRFPGQYIDEETGLHYNWNRYYDPATGRYVTADPIGLEGGMNLYAYVGDPINDADPKGLCPANTCDKWKITIVGTISAASNKFKTVKNIMKRGGIAAIGLKASLTADPECCMDETQKDYHFEGVGLGVGFDISGSLSGDGKCFKTECIAWEAHEGFGRVTSAGAGAFDMYYSRLIITTPQTYLDFGGNGLFGSARGTGFGVSAETTLGKWTLGKDTSPK